jgi:hypothetical protein
MELFIFGRFHSRETREAAVADALRQVAGPSCEEEGCLSLQVSDPPAIPACSTSIRAGRAKPRSNTTPSCRTPSGFWSASSR